MSIRTNSKYAEMESEGDIELVMVAVTYTGSRSAYSAQGMRSDGGYPALDAFQGPGPGDDTGETKLVLLPSSRLGWWEQHAHFDVDYTPETVAETMLSMNFMPEQIVGPGYDPRAREELTDKLNLDPFTGEEDLREQLREVAGVSGGDDGVETPEEPDTRLNHLTGEYSRSVLVKVANSYEDVDDLTEEEGVNSVSHLKQTALAEFLADKDDNEVDRRLATAEQGGDL